MTDEYKAALERARQFYNSATTSEVDERKVLETIFPELKEKRGEAIRKTLIKHFQEKKNCVGDTWAGMNVDDVLAWLERQEELSLMDGNSDLYFDEWNRQRQNPTKRECFEEGMRYADRLQKEPKSKLYDMGRWDEESYINGIHHVLQNPEAYGLTKQKPAEWSERDEKILASAMSHIADSQCFDHFHDISKEDIYTWLKSLRPRPHWKPSEEQMKALLSKLPVVKGGGDKIQDILESLYDDLKKLMQP